MYQADHRKPGVYLLVYLPIMLGGSVFLVFALLSAFADMAGVPRNIVPQLNQFLIGLPALFLWIPTSLLLANVILYVIPPFRRSAEAYVRKARRPGFVESQKQMFIAWLVMALICVPLIVLGFVL